MPAQVPLYQEVEAQIKRITAPRRLRVTAVRRLALLVTGVIAAKSGVINQVAAELDALGVTRASSADSVARRLRRTLGDARLEPQACYAPVLAEVLDWPALLQGGRRLVLALDESSKGDELHLVRVSLPYRGGSLPLAWALWPQNEPLPEGQYWATVEAVLDRVAALLPADLEVVLLADRAFDIPAFVDRVAARGWHWVVRCKANGTLRFRDQDGREQELRAVVRRHLPAPGRCWRGRGRVFKDAGWRDASVVALWGRGYDEPLVLLTDLPPRWRVARLYQRRGWVEPGFRNDKKRGWHWEESQVRGLAHHERRLLALAWASLVMLCLGAEAAAARVAARQARGARPRPVPLHFAPQHPAVHARESLFTLGLQRARQWLYRPWTVAFRWRLPQLDADSWTRQWQRAYG